MTTALLFEQALGAMLAHPLRATLSALGIVMGVATVVAALAIGEGARREAIAEISDLGIDNILIRSVSEERSGDGRTPPRAPSLVTADLAALERAVPGTVAAAALRKTSIELHAGSRRALVHVVGATERWDDVTGIRTAAGRWLLPSDLRAARRVAVIGSDVARLAFDNVTPVGRMLPIHAEWYLIVGVLADADTAARRRHASQSLDMKRAVVIPLTAMDVSLGAGDTTDRVEEIVLRTADGGAVPDAAGIVARTMRRRYPSGIGYEILIPRDLLQARLRAQRTFDVVLVGIGLLALSISGIGIMNIMLASVAERTAEVGVRRAYGARARDITRQFALEAALLCAAGGVAGLALGVLLASAIAVVAQWPVAVSWTGAALALLLAAGTGLVFGTYPARRAALLDPVEALRQG